MKTEKLLSIALVLCLLMSLVSVCLVGSASAATIDAATAGDKYETVLDMQFEGTTNNGGIAISNAGTNAYIKNGYFYFVQTSGATVWFANSNTANAGEGEINPPSGVGSKPAASEAELAGLFKFEPETTYKISFKYSYRNNSRASRGIDLFTAADPYSNDNNNVGKRDGLGGSTYATMIDDNQTSVTETPVDGDFNYGEWKYETVIFTTQTANKLTAPYFGIRPSYVNNGEKIGVCFDYITIEKVVATTYVYDYKTGEDVLDVSGFAAHGNMCNYNGTTEKTHVAGDGFHFMPANNNPFGYVSYDWNHNGLIYDEDNTVNGKHYVSLTANNLYVVTAKYKAMTAGTTIGLAVLENSNGLGGGATWEFADAYHKNTTDDFQYLTGIVDTDAITSFAGKSLILTGRGTGEFLVESVTVTVYPKAADDRAVVITDALAPYSYDITWVKAGGVVGTENGNVKAIKDAYLSRTLSETYLGSYLNPTYSAVKVLTEGDTYAFTPNGTDGDTTVVSSAEDAEKGSVIEISAGVTYDSTATFNLNGFQPEAGKKYYISFDAKLVSNNSEATSISASRFYLASKAGIMMGGSKTEVPNDKKNLTSDVFTAEWKTMGWVYEPKTAVDASYTYLLFAIPYSARTDADKGPSFTVLVDNFKVVEYVPTDAASAPNNAKNAASSIRGVGTKADGSYQSAGIRFKATVDAATKAAASEIGFVVAPAKAAVAYGAEWYAAEGELTAGVSALSKACYKAGTATDVVYETDKDGNCDYQMILTGLSREDGRTAYNQRFVAVMYIENAEGVREYYNLGEASYNEVKTVYDIKGYEVPAD